MRISKHRTAIVLLYKCQFSVLLAHNRMRVLEDWGVLISVRISSVCISSVCISSVCISGVCISSVRISRGVKGCMWGTNWTHSAKLSPEVSPTQTVEMRKIYKSMYMTILWGMDEDRLWRGTVSRFEVVTAFFTISAQIWQRTTIDAQIWQLLMHCNALSGDSGQVGSVGRRIKSVW